MATGPKITDGLFGGVTWPKEQAQEIIDGRHRIGALTFTATIDPALEDVSHVRDALTTLSSGLVTGISPAFGFQLSCGDHRL